MAKVAIALSHGHAAKWLQVVIHSLKKCKNGCETDIFIAHTWPGHPSIKAITENDLSEDINVIDCKIRLTSHATGLDEILDHIAELDYDFMFCAETDCIACEDGWLDWFVRQIGEVENKAMAGFFWDEQPNHYNINPSGTLYRVPMLLKYHKEVRDNKEGMFYHPRGDRPDSDQEMDANIKKVAGVFSETRGIKNPNPRQKQEIEMGVPRAAWFEPGSYLYYRSIGEYDAIKVPCEHIYMKQGFFKTPEATYYGGRETPQYIHYWGGTRAWDHLKHPVNDQFVKTCSPFWLDREDYIWKNTVPEQYRAMMVDLYKEIHDHQGNPLEGMGYDKS